MVVKSTDYTPAQLRGVTDTSDAGPTGPDHGIYLLEADRELVKSEPLDLDDIRTGTGFEGPGVPPILVPGEGRPSEACGVWAPRAFCDGPEAHIDLGRHQCARRECPDCWSGQWARPRTVSVVSRVAAARYAASRAQDKRLVHGVFSPPEGSASGVSGLYEARTKAVALAKEHGIRGGVMFVHPYRVNEDAKREFKAAKKGGYDRGIWLWLKRECDEFWYNNVHWAPHFHVIGLCRDFKPSKPEGDKGWICKNIKRGGSHSFEPFRGLTDEAGYTDMIGATRYLLSHVGVVPVAASEERQSVTWFGDLAGVNFDPEEELSDGAWSTIQRKVEELVGGEADDGALEAGEETCLVDGCEGTLHPIWDVPAYIEQRGDDLSVEALVRLRVAFDWAIGDDDDLEAPSGGWPVCRSEVAAEAALESML